MNPYLDDDLIALGDQARRFASDRIAPGFQERDRTRVLDRTIMKEMGAMGFIAPELPEQFGGLGLGCLAAGVIHEEVARADLSISYINLLASLNGQILSHHGRPEIVKPWLTRLTTGEAPIRHRLDGTTWRLGCSESAATHRTRRQRLYRQRRKDLDLRRRPGRCGRRLRSHRNSGIRRARCDRAPHSDGPAGNHAQSL
jgi:Acyl-CoA dehydrogenase, N-terminal domain